VISDAQIHIWGPNTSIGLGGQEYLAASQTDALTADVIVGEMDAAGVDRAVLIHQRTGRATTTTIWAWRQ